MQRGRSHQTAPGIESERGSLELRRFLQLCLQIYDTTMFATMHSKRIPYRDYFVMEPHFMVLQLTINHVDIRGLVFDTESEHELGVINC